MTVFLSDEVVILPKNNGIIEKTYNTSVDTKLALIRTIEAEKRTHLAELRTGIGILTSPLSLLTILIATSDYYSIEGVLWFVIGLVIGIIALAIIGGYLVVWSLISLRNDYRLRREVCIDTRMIIEELVDDEVHPV
jgi:uncharacterized membrane protein YidH (DUF202 family)